MNREKMRCCAPTVTDRSGASVVGMFSNPGENCNIEAMPGSKYCWVHRSTFEWTPAKPSVVRMTQVFMEPVRCRHCDAAHFGVHPERLCLQLRVLPR